MNNILGTLGLCRRAGKVIFGFDAVIDELKSPKGKAYGVIMAADLSEKTKKEVLFYCGKYNAAAETVNITLEEISGVLGKPTGVIAILDKGLFNSIIKSNKSNN